MTRPDVTTMIRDLTQPIVHREPITQPKENGDGTYTLHTTGHITKHPSLIRQLEHNTATLERLEGTTGTFTSKPSANIEAVDALMRIDKESAAWVRKLGEDDPSNTTAVILKLGGMLKQADRCDRAAAKHASCCTGHAIERDIRSWWVQARIIAGWDKAPWAPDNTCPLCATRGTLRIRILDEAERLATGFCTNCAETWSPDEIGILIEHVRQENSEVDEPA